MTAPALEPTPIYDQTLRDHCRDLAVTLVQTGLVVPFLSCDRCGARPGQPCYQPSGRELPSYHKARWS